MKVSMANVKEEIKRMVESFPDDVTWEDVQYSIYVRERIERGRREAAEGKVLAEEDVERRMKPWLIE
jgi:predicted transcriptional regulator